MSNERLAAVTAIASGDELMREFIPASPLPALLGVGLDGIGDGRAVLSLPFRRELTTMADVVHGGALATLIDTAAMAAAWSGAELPEQLRGSTVALSVQYLAPAVGRDLRAEARVLRRGRSLVFVDVEVSADDEPVARGQATYRIG